MASKIRRKSAKEKLSRQAAGVRRGAPGKRFVGEAQAQSAQDHLEEVRRAQRMAEMDGARRRAEAIAEPIEAVVAQLVQDAVRLTRTLALAPFRLAAAWRRPREA
jgi:hypothetical protein